MRYKITIEYDGTNLLGWQKQNEGVSVQYYLEEAINIAKRVVNEYNKDRDRGSWSDSDEEKNGGCMETSCR